MIFSILKILEKKIKTKLLYFIFLSFLFILIEVFLIGSMYPLFQNFFSENSDNNSINFLNLTFNFDFQILVMIILIIIIFRFIFYIYFNLYKNNFLEDLRIEIASKIFFNFFTYKNYLEFLDYNSSIIIRDMVNETQTFKKYIGTIANLIVDAMLISAISIFLFLISPKIFIF